MKVTIIEGTPEEIREALPGLAVSAGIVVSAPAKVESSDENEDGEPEYVEELIARRVLTRRPLSKEQKAVLTLLYKAGETGLLGTELQSKLGWTRPQFTGLMGAFGNRLVNTPGHVEGTWFFAQEWDYDEASFRYTLPESVRSALRAEKLV